MDKSIFKNINSCIVFLIILLVLFCKITWLFRGNGIEAREDIQGFKNQGEVDVVMVGGSTLLRFYNPLQAYKETGITSYNYATSSAKFDILKEYIEDSRKTNEAELYVINVRTIALLSQEVDEPSLRNWSDSLEPTSLVRAQGISDFVYSRDWDIKKLPAFYFDIIKYHSNIDALSSDKQWSFMNLRNIYNVDKGFAPNVSNVPFTRKDWGESRSQLSEQQQKALNDILDYCDKENIQVLFVCCPYIFSETDEGIINTCGDIIRDRGYDYINFNQYYDEIGIDFDTNFSDVNHVNYLGSIKYTHYLINYISNNYQLVDHRGDPKYSQWDLDYETFLPKMKEMEANLTTIISDQKEARNIGETLDKEQDYYQWYEKIKSKNYSVVIRINSFPEEISLNNPLLTLFKDYSIDISKEHYIGIWNAEKPIISTSDELNAESNIGVGGGRPTEACKISLESQVINVGGIDYIASGSPIQVVVYDNNYQSVIDNVNIIINSDDSVVLCRPQ